MMVTEFDCPANKLAASAASGFGVGLSVEANITVHAGVYFLTCDGFSSG